MRTVWSTKLIYSLIVIMFRIPAEPNVAKNCSIYGSITKYANATPEKKQNEV